MSAQPKAPGVSSSNVLSAGLAEVARVQGSVPVENPMDNISHYGYLNDGAMVPVYPNWTDASKTEPDKNTYLVLDTARRADGDYSYGHHFLYQGHETGKGYITRVNLDADYAHKVTIMASRTRRAPLPGSTARPGTRSQTGSCSRPRSPPTAACAGDARSPRR